MANRKDSLLPAREGHPMSFQEEEDTQRQIEEKDGSRKPADRRHA